MTAPIISSQFISGIKLGKDELALLKQQLNLKDVRKRDQIALSIFEVVVDGSVRYCCWAGGNLVMPPDDGAGPPLPALTPVGHATVQTMMQLPFFQGKLAFIELLIGVTPLQEKVVQAFQNTPPDMMLCFFGDLAGALDGKMALCFNVNGLIDVKDCVGILPQTPVVQ